MKRYLFLLTAKTVLLQLSTKDSNSSLQFLGCHQVFLSTKTGQLSWRTCVNPLCGLEVRYPKVKTFWDISSIVDHLLPHLRIQVVKKISLFSLQGSGPLVIQKGFFKGHNLLGLSPSLSFYQDRSAFLKNLC